MAMPIWQTLDLRGMQPPEPMEQILSVIDDLPAGQALQVLIDREPFPLYRILDRYQFEYNCQPVSDGHFELRIWPAG